jgi:hypothetical protein
MADQIRQKSELEQKNQAPVNAHIDNDEDSEEVLSVIMLVKFSGSSFW